MSIARPTARRCRAPTSSSIRSTTGATPSAPATTSPIVRLDGPIDDAGPPPALYGGNREDGARIVMVGWGSRGIGSVGQKPKYYTTPGKAAATNKVDEVMDAAAPAAQERRCRQLAGRHAPPRERGRRTARRHFRLGRQRRLGLDQDGGGGWAICGVNANGNGDTYGAQSWFARVSGVRDWLNATMPGLRFVELGFCPGPVRTKPSLSNVLRSRLQFCRLAILSKPDCCRLPLASIRFGSMIAPSTKSRGSGRWPRWHFSVWA